MTELAEVREQYRAGKAALLASLADSGPSTRGIHGLLKRFAAHADKTLLLLWERGDFPVELCLIAVGGFGRGELFPHSDVDVLVLFPGHIDLNQDLALKAKLEKFVSNCWDSGLEVGSSVRTAAHCVEEAEKDVTAFDGFPRELSQAEKAP